MEKRNEGKAGDAGGPATTGAGDPGSAPRARVRDDLMTLEYPRFLNKPGGEQLRVDNAEGARAAVADGWAVDANEAAKPAATK
jgi:hypothetical protein